MMKFVRRVALLVAFYLIAPAAPAFAECAWVLWDEFEAGKEVDPKSPIGAYTTKAQCDAALARNIARWKEAWEKAEGILAGKLTITSSSVSFSSPGTPSSPGLDRTNSFVCLPDTVDPRGPKR